jgi:aspartate racemase
MSWESTTSYYTLINQLVRKRLGGLHSASLLLYSFDFARIEQLQTDGDWPAATREMVATAQKLEQAGAECLLICTNTMHLMADEVQQSVTIPLLHIADITAAAIRSRGLSAPLLLATRYTMEQDFYRQRLADAQVIARIPDAAERTLVHDIIYQELCQGIVREPSKRDYLRVVANALQAGADSVILGCTEVGLLIGAADFSVPVFDTTALHAAAAVDFALS